MLHMHTNLEQGHKNIITNMLCLGMYLGLLEYTDMEQLKTITMHIDIIQIRFLPFCPLSVKPKTSAVHLNYP